MVLDKFYGSSSKLKEMIDVCHQNGIAVILDVALNHAFGRNPMVRMWMNDPDGDGWDLLQLKVLILIQLLSIVIT
jgi:glycosidase